MLYDNIQESANFIKEKLAGFSPHIGIILGSGLGGLVDQVENAMEIPYTDIPHFPKKAIKGHAGKLVCGSIEGKNVLLMAGRFHLYQGYRASEAAYPVYVLKQLGISALFVTNAAGGLPDKGLTPGDLMLITDMVNELGDNPLIGYEEDERIGPLFVPMTKLFDSTLQDTMRESAKESGIAIKEGIYTATHGPSFETWAEIKKLSLYSDTIGMSTYPEVVVCNQIQLPCLAMSCVTNVHSTELPPSHEEVLETGKASAEKFETLVRNFLRKI